MSIVSPNYVQTQCESMGINLKPNQLNVINEEAENYVREIVKKAALLQRNSHSEKLSPKHINTVLESINKPSVLGYQVLPNVQKNLPFSLKQTHIDQTNLFYFKYHMVHVMDVLKNGIFQKPKYSNYKFHWLITEGAINENADICKIHSKSGENRSELKSLIRNVNHDHGTPVIRQLVKDTLSSSLQTKYVNIIGLLRDDDTSSLYDGLEIIRTDASIHKILPYLLQFIIGQYTMRYNKPGFAKILINVLKALTENPSICIYMYTHVFLQIVYSFLICNFSCSSILYDDLEIKNCAAIVLENVCKRSEEAYPCIYVSNYNFLVKRLFYPYASVQEQYGSLKGIKVLGNNFIISFLPGLASLCKLMFKNMRSGQDKLFVTEFFKTANEMLDNIEDADMTDRNRYYISIIKSFSDQC